MSAEGKETHRALASRRRDIAVVLGGLATGALAAAGLGPGIAETVRHAWDAVLLPAFSDLFMSGFPFCL